MDMFPSEQFIKTDNGTSIHEYTIRWMKRIDECLIICNKNDNCPNSNSLLFKDTRTLCKINNPEGYNRLIKYF
jgi:hypothetical protein